MMAYLMEAPLDRIERSFHCLLLSVGPDRDDEYRFAGDRPRCLLAREYDPTNGSVSSGDIYRLNGPKY